jgi:hypothetical protein
VHLSRRLGFDADAVTTTVAVAVAVADADAAANHHLPLRPALSTIAVDVRTLE